MKSRERVREERQERERGVKRLIVHIREREEKERQRERGGERKNYKHKKIHGILSCRASLRGTK